MTLCLLLLSVVALTAAVPVPRALTRAEWPDREPVVALWVWQCLVATVLLCCLTALAWAPPPSSTPSAPSSSPPHRRL